MNAIRGVLAIGIMAFVGAAATQPALEWRAYEWMPDAGRYHAPVVRDDGLAFDGSMWSIDSPDGSILAVISWTKADLAGVTVNLKTRPEALDLKGGYMDFWINANGTSWHTIQPVSLGATRLTLSPDPALWRQSWTKTPDPLPLPEALRHVEAFGLAFSGFSEEVTGTIVLERFAFQ